MNRASAVLRSAAPLQSFRVRPRLPNVSLIGFIGTPIEKTDANTRAIFGDYISIYDIQSSDADKATVPIYYERRNAKRSQRRFPFRGKPPTAEPHRIHRRRSCPDNARGNPHPASPTGRGVGVGLCGRTRAADGSGRTGGDAGFLWRCRRGGPRFHAERHCMIEVSLLTTRHLWRK